jgi:hypothetical protein
LVDGKDYVLFVFVSFKEVEQYKEMYGQRIYVKLPYHAPGAYEMPRETAKEFGHYLEATHEYQLDDNILSVRKFNNTTDKFDFVPLSELLLFLQTAAQSGKQYPLFGATKWRPMKRPKKGDDEWKNAKVYSCFLINLIQTRNIHFRGKNAKEQTEPTRRAEDIIFNSKCNKIDIVQKNTFYRIQKIEAKGVPRSASAANVGDDAGEDAACNSSSAAHADDAHDYVNDAVTTAASDDNIAGEESSDDDHHVEELNFQETNFQDTPTTSSTAVCQYFKNAGYCHSSCKLEHPRKECRPGFCFPYCTMQGCHHRKNCRFKHPIMFDRCCLCGLSVQESTPGSCPKCERSFCSNCAVRDCFCDKEANFAEVEDEEANFAEMEDEEANFARRERHRRKRPRQGDLLRCYSFLALNEIDQYQSYYSLIRRSK